MTYSPANAKTAYLPTTREFDVADDDELKRVLSASYTDCAQYINLREIAQYDQVELLTGQQFFTAGNNQVKRKSFRKAFELGAVAAGATVNIAHGLTGVVLYTRIYGTCITGVVDYRPIPWASATLVTDQVQLRVVGANIEVINGATAPAITSGLIVLEYLKN